MRIVWNHSVVFLLPIQVGGAGPQVGRPIPDRPYSRRVRSLDGVRQGYGADDGGFFILPYWLGRYHRFISGPASR